MRRSGKRIAVVPGGMLRELAAVGGFLFLCSPAGAQNWTVTTAPSANWVSVASSADGNRLAALIQGGEAVYVSTNAGGDWTLSSPANGGVVGTGIACSADGKTLYFSGTTQIYSSTNAAASWNPTLSPFASWTGVACSADGTHVAASSALRRGSPEGVITSPDGGATWGASTPPMDAFLAVASSADGSKLVAIDNTAAAIYTSSDGGNSWAQHTPPLQEFTALASSADGTILFASSLGSGAGGGIFKSTNAGINWAQTTAPLSNWVSVACSADARMVLAAGGGANALGHLYLSTDSGATWNVTNSLHTHWSSVAVSADGTKLVAAENAGHIHTLHLVPFTFSPSLSIRPAGVNTVVSWLMPSMNLTLQQNIDLASSNWVNVTAAPILNTANLHQEVSVTSTIGNAFFRLSAGGGGSVSGVQAIANVLRGPWEALVVNTIFTPTFNADGTFTATIQPPTGGITNVSGGYTLKPPLAPSGFANPQANLTMTNTQGAIVFSGDALLFNPDQLFMTSVINNFSGISPVGQLVLSKMTP